MRAVSLLLVIVSVCRCVVEGCVSVGRWSFLSNNVDVVYVVQADLLELFVLGWKISSWLLILSDLSGASEMNILLNVVLSN